MIRHKVVLALVASTVCWWKPVHVRAAADWHEQLATPSPEFSQMPFWFWNDNLTEDEIVRQLADFRERGVFGFVIHARMGLSTEIPYMGQRWLELVRTAVEEAARTNMRVCLYDEGMYPSGSAHGAVVRSNPAFAAHGLLAAFEDVSGPTDAAALPAVEGEHVATLVARRQGEGRDLVLSDLRTVANRDEPIALPTGDWRVMTFSVVPSDGRIRGVHEGEEDREPGAPMAADLLNPEAMRAFIRFAYDPYHRTVGEHFGKTVIGMFTDEPSMLGRGGRRGLKPWTGGLAEYFKQRRDYDLLPLLPGLFFNIGAETGKVRDDFARTLAERLDDTYYKPLSEWCASHGIALTGHPAGATEIYPLRWFQIPGQDIVWRGVVPENNRALQGHNSAIGKCSSSVARHDGHRLNSNEVYGAYGWQLTMEEMKWLADWLMVRGVNLLYPHAFYYSIRDYRVHERPPDLGPNNAWWPHYRVFADYTARLCGLMTDSGQVCNVAILCSNKQLPWRAAKYLYCNQVDFNYVEDWRLCEQALVEGDRLVVGRMSYALLIVDQDMPLAGDVADAVARLEAAGVKVRYCRGEPDASLIEGLPRDLTAAPAAPDLRCAHVVKDGVDFYLLVNEGEQALTTTVSVPRVGAAEWFDAWEGSFEPTRAADIDGNRMSLPLHLERRSSVVLCVDTGKPAASPSEPPAEPEIVARMPLPGLWKVTDGEGRQLDGGLGDWLTNAHTADYTGTLSYHTTFDLHKVNRREYAIDLGGVGDFATATLNGESLPVCFWAPYRWNVTDRLRDGRNELTVCVTNSLVNKYSDKISRPSGLMGPVEILTMTEGQSQANLERNRSDSDQPGRLIRVAAVQMVPAAGDVPANLDTAERLVRQAATAHDAKVIVLPECTVQGYTNPADGKLTLSQTRELAEPVPGPAVGRFARLADELDVYLVLGLHEKRGGEFYNSAVLLSPGGKVEGTYSKVHINKYERQMGWTNGSSFYVWPCRINGTLLNIGIMICFDREVPEAARCLTMLGADIILVPQATACTSLFPIHRDQLRVRAYENEVYLAMANYGGEVFKGHGMIVDPTGEVLVLGGPDEQILVADIDLDHLHHTREAGIYGRHHRQPAAYGPLLNDAH